MPKLLIADDEAHIRNIMRLKFAAAGFDVALARDGREALEMARESRPDAMLSDLQMPEMTGLDLCRALELDATTAGIPTVLVTSREFEIGEAETAGTSIRSVIAKPFSPVRVIAAVRDLLAAAPYAKP